MIEEWLRHVWELTAEPADFYSGVRKILRGRMITFEGPPQNDLILSDAGYTSMKMSMLKNLYHHKESHNSAIKMWRVRRDQAKYGSVGFTTFNHLLKADPTKGSKRASKMGPCIQAVNVTWVKKTAEIDCFYRTTEFYKKFPADLVFLRDVLLEPFDFDGCPITKIRFHFANMTLHPMYFAVILPHEEDPVAMIHQVKDQDHRLWENIIKATARYLCEEWEHGIQKHSQSLHVQKDVLRRLSEDQKEVLRKYLREHHPGMKRRRK